MTTLNTKTPAVSNRECGQDILMKTLLNTTKPSPAYLRQRFKTSSPAYEGSRAVALGVRGRKTIEANISVINEEDAFVCAHH